MAFLPNQAHENGTEVEMHRVTGRLKKLCLRHDQQVPHDTSSSSSSEPMDLTAQSGHANEGDWEEQVYQKIKALKDQYLLELRKTYLKISTELQKHDSPPQQQQSEELERLKFNKAVMRSLISFLKIPKPNIHPWYMEMLAQVEELITSLINVSGGPEKAVPELQQGQPQSQTSQIQSHGGQTSATSQPMNAQRWANPVPNVASGQENVQLQLRLSQQQLQQQQQRQQQQQQQPMMMMMPEFAQGNNFGGSMMQQIMQQQQLWPHQLG